MKRLKHRGHCCRVYRTDNCRGSLGHRAAPFVYIIGQYELQHCAIVLAAWVRKIARTIRGILAWGRGFDFTAFLGSVESSHDSSKARKHPMHDGSTGRRDKTCAAVTVPR